MKILLGIDNSEASATALSELANRPWPTGSSIEVLHVVEPSHLWALSDTAAEADRVSEDLVKTAVCRLQSAGLKAAGITKLGDPKRVLLDQAARSNADLMVVGSHGASLTRYLLGNVAATVARYAPCSVEVVRGGGKGARKILLATDGSEYSQIAARSIAERPWPAGTVLRVLGVVEFELPPAEAFLEPPLRHSSEIDARRQEGLARAQDAVAEAAAILSRTGVSVSESVSVLLATPKAVILDEAREWGADLVVLGSHGRRGLDRFLLGSVSEAVAMHAGCSVEVVRQKHA